MFRLFRKLLGGKSPEPGRQAISTSRAGHPAAERTTVRPAAVEAQARTRSAPEKQAAKKSHVPSVPGGNTSPRRGQARVRIGFDYGTHSTKVVVREGQSQTAHVQLLDEPAASGNAPGERYPWFASPSLIALENGRLYFGAAALKLPKSRRLHGLKAAVCGQADFEPGCFKDLLCAFSGNGLELVVAAYLRWAFWRLREQLDSHHGAGQYSWTLQLGAPMDRSGDAVLSERSSRLLALGSPALSERGPLRVDQGHDARALLGQIAEESSELPDRLQTAQAPWKVMPETLAQLVAVARDPAFGSELYTVFDVGGGTSEVTCAHVQPDLTQVYGDRSVPLGARHLSEPNRLEVLEHLARAQRETWFAGLEHVRGNPHARQRFFHNVVIRTGGGWYDKGLTKKIAQNDPASYYEAESDTSYVVRTFAPRAEVLGVGSSSYHPKGATRARFELLATALGLSVPRPQWPTSFGPDDLGSAEDLIWEPAPEVDPHHGHA